jgi:hypothetical protein
VEIGGRTGMKDVLQSPEKSGEVWKNLSEPIHAEAEVFPDFSRPIETFPDF